MKKTLTALTAVLSMATIGYAGTAAAKGCGCKKAFKECKSKAADDAAKAACKETKTKCREECKAKQSS